MSQTRPERSGEVHSFRLPTDISARLQTEAEAMGTSPHLLARHLLIERIENGALQQMTRDLQAMRVELETFRADFALVVEALLLLVSDGAVTPTEAEEWVATRLRRVRSHPRG